MMSTSEYQQRQYMSEVGMWPPMSYIGNPYYMTEDEFHIEATRLQREFTEKHGPILNPPSYGLFNGKMYGPTQTKKTEIPVLDPIDLLRTHEQFWKKQNGNRIFRFLNSLFLGS